MLNVPGGKKRERGGGGGGDGLNNNIRSHFYPELNGFVMSGHKYLQAQQSLNGNSDVRNTARDMKADYNPDVATTESHIWWYGGRVCNPSSLHQTTYKRAQALQIPVARTSTPHTVTKCVMSVFPCSRRKQCERVDSWSHLVGNERHNLYLLTKDQQSSVNMFVRGFLPEGRRVKFP